jgi:outer membrane protein TolC
MKHKKAVLFINMILFFAISLCAFAQTPEKPPVNSFSLEQSVEEALKNNIQLKIEAEEYEKAKVERNEARATSDKIVKIRDDKILRQFVPQAFDFEGAQAKDLLPTLREAEELIAKKNLDLERQNLRIKVKKAYYGVLLAQDNLANAKIQLDRAQVQLKNAEAGYKNGVAAKDTVLMAKYGLADAEANLVTAEKSLDLAKMNLNKLMGRGLTQPLKLTAQFEYTPKELRNVEEAVESALKLRPEVIAVSEMRDVAQLNCDLSLKYYAENTFIYKKAKIDLDKANLGLKEAEDSVSLAVRAAHLSAKEAMEKLKASENMKNAALESHRIIVLKHKSQVATMADVLVSMDKLTKAEMAYTSSVYNFNVAKAEFDNWAGVGLEK